MIRRQKDKKKQKIKGQKYKMTKEIQRTKKSKKYESTIFNQEVMQRPCAPKARRPMFGPLCIRLTILPFLCSCPFLVSIFAVGLCVLLVLCGPSKATARCYTSICDGIIVWGGGGDFKFDRMLQKL